MFSINSQYLANLRKIALILVFVLPLIFVSVGLILTTRPVNKESPQYNFIYSSNYNSNNKFTYKVSNNTISKIFKTDFQCISKKITENDQVTKTNNCIDEPILYYHNVTSNKSEVISFDQVKNYKIIGNEVSPDGFRFESYASNYGSSGLFNPFGGSRSQENVLVKNSSILPQSIIKSNTDSSSIEFLAWHDNK